MPDMPIANGSLAGAALVREMHEPPSLAEFTVDGQPRKYQMRNMLLLSAYTALFTIGSSEYAVILTPYFNWLGLSNMTIGLIGASGFLGLVGTFLAPLLSRRFTRKKWLLLVATTPYLWFVGSIGIAILVAIRLGPGAWLAGGTVGNCLLLPLLCGWGGVIGQEFLANCISRERIGAFIGAQSIISSVSALSGSLGMTLLSARIDVPMRYAVAFLATFATALLGAMLVLFAHETPTPPAPVEPFWRPAQTAIVHDVVFRRLLVVGLLLSVLLVFPSTFMPLLAIREWNMPDWVASGFATVLAGGRLIGAALGAWLGQTRGYVRSLTVCLTGLPLAMLPLVWPRTDYTASYDVYRFLISGALYGIASTGVIVALQSLMYLLAPATRRSGYFSAFLIMQAIAASGGVSLSGVVFRPGNFQHCFFVVMILCAIVLVLSPKLLRKLREAEVKYGRAPATTASET